MRMGLGLGLGGLQMVSGVGSPYSAEAEAYFAAMASQGDAAYKSWVDTFIESLRSGGLLPKLCGLWILANKDADASYINLINPSGNKIVPVGATPATYLSFTPYTGWNNPASTVGYALNTQISPNDFASITNNSMSMGAFSRTNNAGPNVIMGCSSASSDTVNVLLPYSLSGKNQNCISGRPANTDWTITQKTDGMHIINKLAATTNIVSYRNGTEYSTANLTDGIKTDKNLYLLASNANGAVALPTNRVLSLAFLGLELTTSQIASLNTAIATLLTTNVGGVSYAGLT